MSYKATTRGYDLKITDKESLLKYVNEELPDRPHPDLEDAMKSFCCADSMVIDSDGTIDELRITYLNYHIKDWESLAPFLSGYIEWIGEDDEVWRDYFRNGKVESEYPEIIWPSEYFYTEKWCDEDIASQILGFNIPENDSIFNDILDEAKIRVERCFDNTSYRSEQVEQIISEILRERFKRNEDDDR